MVIIVDFDGKENWFNILLKEVRIRINEKIQLRFTAILGLIITITIYSKFNEKYYFNLQSFFNERYDNMEKTTVFISPSLNNKDILQVIEHFIYSDDFYACNFIYTNNDEMVNFADITEQQYYSVNSNDKNAIIIKVLDDSYRPGVLHSLQAYRTFHQLKDVINNGDMELCVVFYVEDKGSMKNLKEALNSLVSLKKSSVNMKLVFINLTVKVLLMAVTISPMLSLVNEGVSAVGNINTHLKYYDKDKYRYNLSGTSNTYFTTNNMDESLNISEDYFKVIEKGK